MGNGESLKGKQVGEVFTVTQTLRRRRTQEEKGETRGLLNRKISGVGTESSWTVLLKLKFHNFKNFYCVRY